MTVFGSCEGTLPPTVMRWAGMSSDEGGYDNGCLASMNDDGASFKEIADIIKVEYEEL